MGCYANARQSVGIASLANLSVILPGTHVAPFPMAAWLLASAPVCHLNLSEYCRAVVNEMGYSSRNCNSNNLIDSPSTSGRLRIIRN